jgi:mono/diheme cytochrome c family protein
VSRPAKAILVAVAATLVALAPGCGGGAQVKTRGAQLFAERCSGCHTLKAAGTEGSILSARPTGPNLNKRKLTMDEVLFAIRNGGFSGAIMPQNAVVGSDAAAVAEFVSKYAGAQAKSPPTPQVAPAGKGVGGQASSGETSAK